MRTHPRGAARLAARLAAVTLIAALAPAPAPTAAPAAAPAFPAEPFLAATSGVPLSQGAAIIGATDWHAAGYTGGGVRIGIIDGGFRGLAGLPAGTFGGGVEVRCYTEVGTYGTTIGSCDQTNSTHGTAVAETVAAAAPGARVLVANPISFNDLKSTVAWMASRGVRIVNASFNSGDVFEGPGDGSSPYLDAYYRIVDDVVGRGMLWVGAAGNSGDGGWTGSFTDDDADGWLDFAPANPDDPSGPDETNAFSMQAGSRVRIAIRWPEPWGRADEDLDLYLYPAGSEEPVASGTNRQTGSGYPVERLTYRATSAGTFEVAIRSRSGAIPSGVQLLMESQGSVRGFEYRVTTGTLPAPADTNSAGAVVVGAVDVRSPDTLEEYSSRGPTADGRFRPDLVAPDCADTSIGAFCGTSQATPYVSGAAALLLQADPTLTAAGLAATLRARTTPLPGTSSPDPASGWGRLTLGMPPAVAPPNAATISPTGTRTISSAGAGQVWRGLAAVGPRVHVAYTDSSGALGPGSLVVYRGSTDGGATFAAPVRLSTGAVDAAGATIPAAHAAVAAAGPLVAAAWLEVAVGSAGPATLFVATSPDAGVTWSAPVAVSPTDGRAGRPSIATDGVRVAVAWTDRATGRVSVAVSPDGGVTWPTQVVPATTTLVPFGAAQGRDALPAVALSGSTLHLAWSSTSTRLVYRRSTSLGASWSAPVALDSLAAGASRPWVAASGSSVAVGYAGRLRAGGRLLAYVRTSGTGGASWNARALVAATTSLASSYPVVTIAGSVVRYVYAGCTTSACTRARLWYRQSSNRGRTWSAATGLTSATQNARPAGLAATSRVLVLFGLNASTSIAGTTVYLRVR